MATIAQMTGRLPSVEREGHTQPHQERPLMAARGIVNGLLIAAPFWVLVAVILYLLW